MRLPRRRAAVRAVGLLLLFFLVVKWSGYKLQARRVEQRISELRDEVGKFHLSKGDIDSIELGVPISATTRSQGDSALAATAQPTPSSACPVGFTGADCTVSCHTAIETDESHCWTSVIWAQQHGIHDPRHEQWYGDLDAESSLEQFQEALWSQCAKSPDCPKPPECSKPCSTGTSDLMNWEAAGNAAVLAQEPTPENMAPRITMEETVVFCLSRRSGFAARETIRETWAEGHDQVYFVVGALCDVPPVLRQKRPFGLCKRDRLMQDSTAEAKWAEKQGAEEKRLQQEAMVNRDIVRMPDVDVYKTLPAKVRYMYEWGTKNTKAKWFAKIDDDSFARVDSLAAWLAMNPSFNPVGPRLRRSIAAYYARTLMLV